MVGTPRPVLAALLSIIPGVGTMYNGQYAKGIAYLLIISVFRLAEQKTIILKFSAYSLAVAWIYQVIGRLPDGEGDAGRSATAESVRAE